MSIKKLFRSMCVWLLLAGWVFVPLQAVQARPAAESVYDLIAEVNALRVSSGLEPYDIDNELMALAQAQADYQASIETLTHSRPDGSGPGSEGITAENIALGPISNAIASWMDDQLHRDTLLGFSSGYVGAGMAEGENGFVYVALAVRRKADTTQEASLPEAAATDAGTTPLPPSGSAGGTPTVEPVLTLTPQEDGTIIHEARRGQTLWDIAVAYKMFIDELVTLNRLSPSNPIIYEGQEILVQPSYTPTITPTITNTPLPPTRTLRPTFTPRPTRATSTVTPTSTRTPQPLLPQMPSLKKGDRRSVGILLIAISGAGLLVVIVSGLLGKRKR